MHFPAICRPKFQKTHETTELRKQFAKKPAINKSVWIKACFSSAVLKSFIDNKN